MPFRELWLLAGPILIGVGVGTGQPMVTGIGVVVLIVGALSRLWARYLFRRVQVRSSLSETRAFQGEPAVVIGTGGLSRLFENDKMFDVLLPDLVLIGLEHALVLNGGTSQRWTASTSEVTQ